MYIFGEPLYYQASRETSEISFCLFEASAGRKPFLRLTTELPRNVYVLPALPKEEGVLVY